jgi:hypothetical protein
MFKKGAEGMLEHPEIGWIERTGYPSWLQEKKEEQDDEQEIEQKAAGEDLDVTILQEAEKYQPVRTAVAVSSGISGRDPGTSPG